MVTGVLRRLPLAISEDELAHFCERNGIRELSFFGSVLRDDFTDTSDVDVLVEFDPPRSLMEHVRVELELQHILQRKADMVTVGALRGAIGSHILATRLVGYVRPPRSE